MDESDFIQEQYVEVPEGQVYVKTWVAKSAEPLLLLHDSLGCVEMWRDFPEQLRAKTGRTVIAYDRLGFGKSSARSELPSLRFVSEEAEMHLPSLLSALGITQFSIFGHSVGGAMAVVAAGKLPDRCLRVITESAQAFVEDRTRHGIAQAQVDFQNPEMFERLQKYHGDKTQWVLDAWIQVWLSQGFSSWSLRNDLPKMKCPVMAIHGDKDEYGSLRFPKMICDLAGGLSQKQVIPDCGHVPHREKPELILELVAGFLRA